jgi:hypothetical protein
MIRKASEIELHPNNINTENGFCLSQSSTLSKDADTPCQMSDCFTCPFQDRNRPWLVSSFLSQPYVNPLSLSYLSLLFILQFFIYSHPVHSFMLSPTSSIHLLPPCTCLFYHFPLALLHFITSSSPVPATIPYPTRAISYLSLSFLSHPVHYWLASSPDCHPFPIGLPKYHNNLTNSYISS